MKLLKLRSFFIALPLAIAVCFTACNNNSADKPSDDTSTNTIEATTPAQDIPTPANDSLTITGKDSSTKK